MTHRVPQNQAGIMLCVHGVMLPKGLMISHYESIHSSLLLSLSSLSFIFSFLLTILWSFWKFPPLLIEV